ncbi:MAG: hypothetical protein HRT68_03685 [Flavobacteriaceae bacterium]|nr:hypothetical protein [Flavobacteriaceae bacterium]
MKEHSLIYFENLKRQIVATFLKNHSASSNISDWKGETIILFQEDLFEKTKAKVSEKWFYTYFKNTPEKLPRIDMLNLLCSYIGEDNWEAFIQKQKTTTNKKTGNLKKLIVPLFLLIAIILYQYLIPKNNVFEFCFVDEDQRNVITKTKLDVEILQDEQSSIRIKTDSLGCFRYETPKESIRFVVTSPYYKTDTVVRYIDQHLNEKIIMSTDYHALMMHYISNGKKKDWKKYRKELNVLIHEDAKIYQVYPKTSGVEFYSKAEFINKLTLPTRGLKNIQILNKHYQGGKIVGLKFMIE